MLFLMLIINPPWDPIRLFWGSKYGINFQSHCLAHCINVAPTVEQLDSQSNCLIEQLRFYYELDVMNMLSIDLRMLKSRY